MKRIKAWLAARAEAKRLKLETAVSKMEQDRKLSIEECNKETKRVFEQLHTMGFLTISSYSLVSGPEPITNITSLVVGPDQKPYVLTVYRKGGYELKGVNHE